MVSQPIHFQNREQARDCLQGELIDAILQSETNDCYPWNPADPEAEAYFSEIEQEFLFSSLYEDEELAQASQSFFAQLHHCWASQETTTEEAVRVSLTQQFAHRVPQAWLEAIATSAQQVFSRQLSLAEQLVSCIQPLLSNWAEEDLLVFARPLAYTMRGSQDVTDLEAQGIVRPVEWAELSPVEQVRLSMAIANAALKEIQNSTSDDDAL
jgi:hypothetical protein